MRVLALDYGSARCGCALSDPTGTLATPIAPVLRPGTKAGLRELRELVAEREVERWSSGTAAVAVRRRLRPDA